MGKCVDQFYFVENGGIRNFNKLKIFLYDI